MNKCAGNCSSFPTGEGGWLALAREVLDIEMEGLAAVRGQLNGTFLTALDLLAACTGRVVVTGIGKSGLVARKIAATFSSTGTPAFYLHPVEGAHGDLGMIRNEDVVLALSNSGETDELNTLIPALRALRVQVVGITSGTDSTLARLSDVVIEARVPREACPMNLAPTASTTAALAVGDALAVCLMRIKDFGTKDFKRVHPAGALGARLSQPVGLLMHGTDLPVVRDDAPVAQALDALNSGGFGLTAVTDASGRLAGVLSDGDVRRMLCRAGFDPARPVAEVMTRSPQSVSATTTAAQVLDLMEAKQITVLPVLTQDGVLAGLVHLHDLLGKGRVRFAPE
ncbi:MAG: KpsF/GutQ family sugar-phosphate isomerase [Proteobacteria bacterium]|nr:KpsF/GutQ family sugar-phosphate isomerase [Pseudomonadota bacterium]MBU1595122.1 KpsF/GutQ family sugar-phosphate isomerase [Pseudomonadota bacterium]